MKNNLLAKIFAISILTIMLFSSVDSVMASNIVFHLHCDKTTEAGEDEVYYVVNTLKSDGTGFGSRLPGDTSHWDMNDGNKRPDVQNVIISDFNLLEGQSAKIVFTIMEEDGGSAFGWLDFAKGVDKRARENGITSPVPVAPFVDFVKSFIPDIGDSDDWIGTFQVDVTKRNGSLVADWSAVQRANFLGYNQQEGRTRGDFRFNGDGTNYYGWGKLNP